MKQQSRLCTFIFALAILLNSTQQCSVIQGYKFPTLKEQISFASSVFYGRVHSVSESVPNNVATVTLSRYQVWKSSHIRPGRGRRYRKPRFLEISGFTSTAMCGPGIPKAGDYIIVFACPENNLKPRGRWDKASWSLNKFAVSAGFKWAKRRSSFYRKAKSLTRKLRRKTRRRKCRGRTPGAPPSPPPSPPIFPPSIEGPSIPADEIDFPIDPEGP